MEIIVYNDQHRPAGDKKKAIIDFLHEHLEQFGDQPDAIGKAVSYALKETPSFGGFILQSVENQTMSCVVVVNKTGMQGYIPENILVYIATHKDHRGKGTGKAMMSKAIGMAEGSIALHVEPDNPARRLYEKLGFTNKYLEMRYIKK